MQPKEENGLTKALLFTCIGYGYMRVIHIFLFGGTSTAALPHLLALIVGGHSLLYLIGRESPVLNKTLITAAIVLIGIGCCADLLTLWLQQSA